MKHYVVNVDHFSDDYLAFFGWINVGGYGGYSKYWSPHYNELQIVANSPPRTLTLDDWNDVQQMGATVVFTYTYP